MSRAFLWACAGSLAIGSPAAAQVVQSGTFDADIPVANTWQDLVQTYSALAGMPAWVANKSAVPVLVAYTDGASPPNGGGTVLPPNSAAAFGKGTHVWVRSLGGGSTVSAGLAAQMAPALATGAATAANQSAVISNPGASAAAAITVQGIANGVAIPVAVVSGGGGGGAISATASSAAPTYAAGSQALSLDLYGSLRSRVENGADVALGATSDGAWAGSGNASTIALLKTIASAALDTTTVGTTAIDQNNPGLGNAVAAKGLIVAGDQSPAAGSWQPLNLTTTGRLKVGVSSATNIAPGALAATTTTADLVACQYNAALTLASAQTAALQCDASGKVRVAASAPTSAVSASSNVAAATASTLLLAANGNRTGGAVVNDSGAVMYLKLSAGASSTSYDYLLAGAVNGVPAQFEIPTGWTGAIYATWASASGNARISERTP